MSIEVNVVGITFALKDDERVKTLRPNGPVKLVHEPDNKYDARKKAIAVFFDGVKIGHIPAKDGGEAIQDYILDGGDDIVAEVERYAYFDDKIKWNEDHIGQLQAVTLSIKSKKNACFYQEVDGDYERVTSLLGWYNPDASDALDRWKVNSFAAYEEYQEYMAEKSAAGTAMHDAIEKWLDGDKEGPHMDLVPLGFLNWFAKHKPEVVSTESRVKDDKIMVAGTFDFLCKIDGRLVAVDWKSSKKVQKKHRIQVGWYAKMAGAELGLVVVFGSTAKQGYSQSWIKPEEVERRASQVNLIKQLKNLEV